jgi:uncharacterized glyoxalase superfamily protein PhnB
MPDDRPPDAGPGPDRPVLDQINLVVGDIDAMIAFYTTLGVEIPPVRAPWSGDHRSATMPRGIDLDFDSSGFAAQWNEGWTPGRPGVVIGFRLATRESVDSTYDALVAAGHSGQQPPYDAFWGARYAVMTDPDGNAVGLMSPIDPARKSPPPTPPSG